MDHESLGDPAADRFIVRQNNREPVVGMKILTELSPRTSSDSNGL